MKIERVQKKHDERKINRKTTTAAAAAIIRRWCCFLPSLPFDYFFASFSSKFHSLLCAIPCHKLQYFSAQLAAFSFP